MIRYIWTWYGQPQEIVLKRKTPKWYVFAYPPDSLSAGKDWRMSQATFDHYTSIGVITVDERSDLPAHVTLSS